MKNEDIKNNKDWITLLDIFRRNPQLLLDFVFDAENGGMAIDETEMYFATEHEDLDIYNWNAILEFRVRQAKIEKERLERILNEEKEKKEKIEKEKKEVENKKSIIEKEEADLIQKILDLEATLNRSKL